MGQNQETLVAIGQLRAIATVANSRADAALCATASLMEALTHLTRTSAPDRIQNAQTALAAARGSQLHPLAQGLHQLTVMGFVVDLCCSLELDDIRQASNVMYEFISCVDRLLKKQDYWASSGRFLVPLSPQSAERLPAVASSNGVITTDVGNNICLQIFWLPRHAVFPLSYLVCAAVTMHKNSQDLKAEEFLKEAAGQSTWTTALKLLTSFCRFHGIVIREQANNRPRGSLAGRPTLPYSDQSCFCSLRP